MCLDIHNSYFYLRDNDRKSTKVSYSALGDGDQALLLVHGLDCNKDIWRSFASCLARDFKVFMLDLPGHGDSDPLALFHSMEALASAIPVLIRKENLDTPILVGHSMGAVVVQSAIKYHGVRYKKVFFLDGPIIPLGLAWSQPLVKTLCKSPVFNTFCTLFVRSMFGQSVSSKNKSTLDAKFEKERRRVTVESLFDMIYETNRRQSDLPNAVGFFSRSMYWSRTKKFEHTLVGKNPSLIHEHYPTFGHFFFREDPNFFAREIKRFLGN